MHHVCALLQAVLMSPVSHQRTPYCRNIDAGVRFIFVHFTQPYEPMICVICHRSIVGFKETKIGNPVSCQERIPNLCSFL